MFVASSHNGSRFSSAATSFGGLSSAVALPIPHCLGYSPDFEELADGTGFKAGGHAGTPVERLPDPIPRHVVIGSVAVRNKANGFYANHHTGGIEWLNTPRIATG